jgi:hypothetical protein
MSETTTRKTKPGNDPTPPTEPATAAPAGLRRRPAITVVAVTLVALGAVAGWMLWSAEDSSVEVLAAKEPIGRGEVIDKSDLAIERIPGDLGWSVIPASQLDDVVGKRAALDVAAGTAISTAAVGDENVPAEGMAVVGVLLEPRQAPGSELLVGDKVKVVVTPASGGAAESVPDATQAQVAGVYVDPETGNTVLDLVVPDAQSALLAARVATGNFAIVLESRDR